MLEGTQSKMIILQRRFQFGVSPGLPELFNDAVIKFPVTYFKKKNYEEEEEEEEEEEDLEMNLTVSPAVCVREV